MVIAGSKKGGKFTPSYVELPASGDTAGTEPFPVQTNILPMLGAKTFGQEERVSFTQAGDGSLSIHCAAGRYPAGVVLSSAMFHYPRGLQGDLVVQGDSSAAISIALVEWGNDAADAANPVKDLPSGILAAFPSGSWGQGNAARQLVITCAREMSTILVRSIHVTPRPPAKGPTETGSWLWNITPWLDRPDRLVSLAKSHGVTDLFLQIQIEHGRIADREKVLSFIGRLSSGGIKVHAVEGDPRMASSAGRAHALDRAQVLRSFRVAAGGALASFQYDIEPYLMPQFDADPARWWDEWAISVNDLARVLGEKVSVAVPFWMLGQPGAQDALQKARGSISAIVVMAYRTDAEELRRIAGKWLDWGGSQGIMIRIALENGALPVEYLRTYTLAEQGALLVERTGATDRLLLFDSVVPGSSTRVAYSYTKETELSPTRISFMNDRPNLNKVLQQLQEDLPAWKAFGGMLVHEIMIP